MALLDTYRLKNYSDEDLSFPGGHPSDGPTWDGSFDDRTDYTWKVSNAWDDGDTVDEKDTINGKLLSIVTQIDRTSEDPVIWTMSIEAIEEGAPEFGGPTTDLGVLVWQGTLENSTPDGVYSRSDGSDETEELEVEGVGGDSGSSSTDKSYYSIIDSGRGANNIVFLVNRPSTGYMKHVLSTYKPTSGVRVDDDEFPTANGLA